MISLMQKIQEIEFLLSLQIQRNHVILNNDKIGFDQICNSKLMIFNLKNDTLVKIIYIPLNIATNRTGAGHLATLIVYYPKIYKRFLEIVRTSSFTIVVYFIIITVR